MGGEDGVVTVKNALRLPIEQGVLWFVYTVWAGILSLLTLPIRLVE